MNSITKGMIQNIVLPAILSLAGCSVPVAPSDVEMIRHFNVNEAAFNGILTACTIPRITCRKIPPV